MELNRRYMPKEIEEESDKLFEEWKKQSKIKKQHTTASITSLSVKLCPSISSFAVIWFPPDSNPEASSDLNPVQ